MSKKQKKMPWERVMTASGQLNVREIFEMAVATYVDQEFGSQLKEMRKKVKEIGPLGTPICKELDKVLKKIDKKKIW